MTAKKEQRKDELISLKDVKTYDKNPFIVDLKGKMFLQPRANMILARGQGIHNTETGEILNETPMIGKRKIVDKSQFAKIYASEIGILHDLSKAGILVFMHLSKVMDYENKALFDYQKQYKLIGYKSHKQPLRGIRELVSKNIIAPHIISGIWWMNPAIVCKGERFAKYTEYLTEEEAHREQELLMKKQGKKFVEGMPEEVKRKYSRADRTDPRDSGNGVLPFPDKNPYKQLDLEEEINKMGNDAREEE